MGLGAAGVGEGLAGKPVQRDLARGVSVEW